MATDQPDRFNPSCKDGGITLAAHLSEDQEAALADNVLGRDHNVRDIPQPLGPLKIDPVAFLIKLTFFGVELEAFHLPIV